MSTAATFQVKGLFLVLLAALGSTGFSQTNPSKPVFLGPTNLSARHGTEFRYQILIGGKGRDYVGSDNFSSTTISNVWSVITNGNGGLTNANGQLNLFASSNASSSNPAAGTLQWGKALPVTNSWLAYMEVLVSNSLPVTSNRYSAAGMNLFQSNRPSGTVPVFTNISEASLLRETVTTNRASSTFILNNLPFDSTFASNTASRYTVPAGISSAGLVFSNLGGTNTLFYRSSAGSKLTNGTGSVSDNTIIGTPGPGTALASPNILLPSGTNWSLTFKTHWPNAFVTNYSYLAAIIVKNQGTDLLKMLTNRVVLGYQYTGRSNAGSAQIATDAFASGRVADSNALANPSTTKKSQEFRISYNASSSSLLCQYIPAGSTNWTNANTFLMANTSGNLGGQWKFTPGKDTFRLILAGDTGVPGGNGNGSSFQMYFTDLQIETVGPEDFSAPSASNTVWVGLRYDAAATNLIQQFSTPGGSFEDLADDPDTTVGLGNWGTDLTRSPLRLRIGAEAGQSTNTLPLGAVALRNFAVIPSPGDIVYSSPNLPAFLNLDTNYGVITGIPPQPGIATNFTIVASNPYGGLTTTQTFRLQIAPVAPILQVTTNGVLRYGATNTNAFVVTATNGPAFGTNPLVFTATGLPAGITRLSTLGGTQAVFGGVPTSLVGTNNSIVFTASNASAGAGAFTSAVTVFPGPPRLVLNPGFELPAYQASPPADPEQIYWTLSNNAVGQNPSAFPGVFFAISNFPSNSLRLISSNGQILARTNGITNSGIFNVVFSMTNAGGTNFLTNTLTINPSEPVLLLATNPVYPSNGIPFGAVSNNFFQFLVDTNEPGYSSSFANSFTLSSDPAGWLTINSSNGAVGGSNNLAGIFNLTVRVIVGNEESETTSLTLTSRPALPLFRVTTNRAQCGTNSTNALVMALTNPTNQLSTNTFPVTWRATNVPPGLSTNLVGGNFVIGSTNPTHSGVFPNITVVASNLAGATTNSNISLTILPARPALEASSNGSFLVFSTSTNTVTVALTNTNGQNTSNFPVGFRLHPTNLPAGWTTNQTAFELVFQTVNPTNIQLNNLTVTVTNAGGTSSTNVSLRVLPMPPVTVNVATNTNINIQYGKSSPNAIRLEVAPAYEQNPTLYPVGFVPSSLPEGVLLTTNRTNRLIAVLGGKNPKQAGKFNITVNVTNISGTNTVPVTLDILPAVPVISVTTTNRVQYGANSPNAIQVTVSSNGQSPADYPLTFSFTTNTPPGGIVFTNTNASGLVASAGSTNPTVVTNHASFTVVVSNQSGAVTNRRTDFKILPALPLFTVSNNPARFGTASPDVLVVTVTNTAGQNTNPGQFPDFRFYSPNLPLGGIKFTNTNGLTARAGSASPNLITNSATITVVVSNAAGTNSTNVSLSLLPAVPEILRSTPIDGRYDQPGTNLLFNINNPSQQNNAIYPIEYVVTGTLPPGLVLFTNSNGPVPVLRIQGTPTNSGIFSNIVVSATNAGGSSALLTNTLRVLPAAPRFDFTANSSMQFEVNVSNALVVTVTNTNAGAQSTNFPIGFVSTNLSNALGFSFTNTNGFVATAGGTPSKQPGTNLSVGFSVTNAGGTNSTNLTLRVLPAAPLFEVTNTAQFGANSPNALVVTVTNTNGQNAAQFPIFFASTNLPIGGINFTNTNGLVGRAGATNPNVVTNAVITVVASNAGGSTTNTNVSLEVWPAAPQLRVTSNGTIQFGVSNTSAITVTVTNLAGQNLTAYPLGFSAANLPTNFGWGLTQVADTNGVVGSTNPTLATNVTNLLITVTNRGGSTSTNLTLRVLPLAPTNFVYTYGPATSNRFRAGASTNTLQVSIQTNGQNTNDFAITFTGSNLPAGLTFATNTGLLSGTPGVATTYQSVFTASNAAGAGTNTNGIPVLAGAAEIVGPTNLVFSNLTTNEYFRYQVSARGAGQTWAGRSDFTNALTNSWDTSGASNSGASVSTNTEALRYVWNTTNTNAAYVTWKQALPLDSDWQVSVKVNFASNVTVTNLSGLNFGDADQYVETGLFAFKDSAASLDDYSLAFFRGNSNQPSGYVDGSGATNTMETNGTSTNAASGLAYLGLAYTASNNELISLGNPNVTNEPWVNLFTNNVSSWTNSANTNSLVLRLQGASLAPTNTNYCAEFSDFVIVPLGNLTYSSSNLPAGLTLNTNTGLISGRPTTRGTNIATIVISNAFGTVTNTIDFRVP